MSHYQLGSGVGRIYVGAPYQRGSGIGSFLGGVFRYVLPLLKRSAKAVGKEALRAGFNIASDVGERNTPFKEAFRSRVRQSTENLQSKAQEKLSRFMNGEGYKVDRAALPSHLIAALGKRKKRKKRTKKIKGTLRKKRKPKQTKRKSHSKKKKRKKKKSRRTEFVDIFK